MRIRLTQHWTDRDGVAHLPGEVVDVAGEVFNALLSARFAEAVDSGSSGGTLTEPVALHGEHGPDPFTVRRAPRRRRSKE